MSTIYKDGSPIGRRKGRVYDPSDAQRDLLRRLVEMYSQAEVADRAGLGRKTVRRLYQQTDTATSVKVWSDLCDAFPVLREGREVTTEDAVAHVLSRVPPSRRTLVADVLKHANLPVSSDDQSEDDE